MTTSERLFTPLLVSLKPDFAGVNFATAPFGKRLNEVFQETTVDFEISCQIQCVKNIRYLSYNLVTTRKKIVSASL